MPFIPYIEEEVYSNRLSQVVMNYLEVADNDVITQSLEWVVCVHLYEALHLLSSFGYWLKEIQIEKQFRARRSAVLFVD